MREKLFELKTDLKGKAKKIKADRQEHKQQQREQNDHSMGWEVYKLSRDFRHHHIAYCELRGRTRDQIEQPREGNEPNEKLIDSIKSEYKDEYGDQETLRISA